LVESEFTSQFPDLNQIYVTRAAEATLLVQRAVKGAKAGDEITAYFDVSGTSCDMSPRVGVGGVLFVNSYHGRYWVFLCAQDPYGTKERHDQYIDEFERITGEDWNRWRFDVR
jgi:hypothetical protein